MSIESQIIICLTTHLWRHLKSIKTDSPISINVGVIYFGYKPHFGRVEWVSAEIIVMNKN